MKRITITMLFSLLILGIAAMDAGAGEAVILACRVDGSVPPVRPVVVDACSASAGVPIPCPPAPTSCSQALANFLSLPGFTINNVQPYAADGTIYTLVQP